VVFWSEVDDAFVDTELGIADVSYDSDSTDAYYAKDDITALDVLSRKVAPSESALEEVLSRP
jgi:hypothetical protein